ncbi:MAG: hypothetical protein ABL984_02910 [Pyrinomonadaceae bacterium]
MDDEWSEDEEMVDSAFLELRRRLDLYGRVKPYRISGSVVYRNFTWKKFPEHTLSVFYSTYGARFPDHGTKLFERITQLCTEVSFSSSFPFGFPQGKSFTSRLDEFAGLMRTKRIDDPQPADNDRNVDVIAYKRFDDHRDNSVLMFIQCTAGAKWNTKKPVPIESFKRYFHFSGKATISSLAITQVIDLNDWRNATDDYGIVLDRARLYRIISSTSFTSKTSLRNSILKWCSGKLKEK